MRPPADQLARLSRLERVAFEAADLLSSEPLTPLSSAYLSVVMGAMIWSCGGRRLNIRGLSVFDGHGKKARVLLVANHRSFFDFYTITAILFWRTKLRKRIFFPVRSTFFYDHPLGPFVNLAMSSMRMYPPVFRDAERRNFNQWSVERCVAELRTPGTILGIHPEGTRNKTDDPYLFLPAQPGAGRIALDAPEAMVIPVFATGISNNLLGELKKNSLAPREHPIDVYFGEPIDFADLRAREADGKARTTIAKRAADRCVDAIRALGEVQRRDRSA